MSTIDRAKEEAQRIADQMRDGAEKLRQNVAAGIPTSQQLHAEGYNYTKVIHQIRTAHLVVLAIQLVVLYMESDRVNYGLIGFFVPFVLIVGNAYVVGNRWYKQVDGRNDFHRFMENKQIPDKAKIGLGLFGGVVLAVLVHFFSPAIDSTFGSMLYSLFTYLSILSGGAQTAVEVYEGVKTKSR
ncbi:hypothetical protein Ddc_03821 [Ditylenchus destructor]|nr:hypothetical protein Ddc_03821 [Ditylenchus destructor]